MNSGNPIEETRTNVAPDELNIKRRRLIRGAIGIAPMVLTLRSGAVAAVSSCTGTKLVTSVTELNTGKGGKLASSVGIAEGDTCITEFDQTDCPKESTEVIKIRTGVGQFAGTVNVNGSGAYCSQATTVNQQVAILSSQAASSLLGT